MESTLRGFKADVVFEVVVMGDDKIGQIWVVYN